MIFVKDASVLINMSKLTLLNASCEYFGNVKVPEMVFNEVMVGKDRGFPDAEIFSEAVKNRMIEVLKADRDLVRKANMFGIYKGEAEAVAVCWQNSGMLASDDYNVRKKEHLIGLSVTGTPAMLLELRKEKKIGHEKFRKSISLLRKNSWFGSAILDKVLVEANDASYRNPAAGELSEKS